MLGITDTTQATETTLNRVALQQSKGGEKRQKQSGPPEAENQSHPQRHQSRVTSVMGSEDPL